MNLRLNTSPSEGNLKEIEKWLVFEDKHLLVEFYCNWNVIKDSFNKKRLFTFHYDENVIGFVTYREVEIHVEIDIFEIESNQRHKGLGHYFYTQIENYFKSLNFVSFKLFCAQRESEKFWRKQHFIQFPQVIYSESDLTFYKPFIKIAIPNENLNDDNVLELWNREPYLVRPNNKPNWSWNINEDGSLESSIFFPCHYN